MWIRVTTDKDAVHLKDPISFSYIEGAGTTEYYFDENTAKDMEQAGFLAEMWEKFDAMFDWGDCDFFVPQKCKSLKKWLQQELQKSIPDSVRTVYAVMLDFANIAIEYDTGLSFDF